MIMRRLTKGTTLEQTIATAPSMKRPIFGTKKALRGMATIRSHGNKATELRMIAIFQKFGITVRAENRR